MASRRTSRRLRPRNWAYRSGNRRIFLPQSSSQRFALVALEVPSSGACVGGYARSKPNHQASALCCRQLISEIRENLELGKLGRRSIDKFRAKQRSSVLVSFDYNPFIPHVPEGCRHFAPPTHKRPLLCPHFEGDRAKLLCAPPPWKTFSSNQSFTLAPGVRS